MLQTGAKNLKRSFSLASGLGLWSWGGSVDQTPVPAELSQCFYSTVISSVGTGGQVLLLYLSHIPTFNSMEASDME